MRKTIFLLLALFSSACSTNPSSSDAIAKVNGLEIRVRDYLNLYENLKPKDISLQGLEKSQMKNLVIQTLVRRAVILTSAESLNVRVSDKELIDAIERMKSGYPDQIFQEMLLEGMVDESEWQEQVRQNLLIDKMFEEKRPTIQAPSMAEALHFYENNPHLFLKPEIVRALHIVVADEKTIGEIRTQLMKSNNAETFRSLARRHSTGPEAQKDAVISVEKGMMPPEIDDVLFGLREGGVSDIVKSPYGYHLFRVLDKQPSVNLDFKQVRQQIFERLYEDRKQSWLEKFEEELIRSAEISYNRGLIEKL